jgi:hypothetical protein
MEDGDSNKNMEENLQRESFSKIFNVRNVFQSIWVRYNSISTYITNREFVVGKFNFILRIGIMFWILFLVTKII